MATPEYTQDEQEIVNRAAFLAEVQALGSDSILTREALASLGAPSVKAGMEQPPSTGQFGDRTVMGDTVVGTAYSTTEAGRHVEIVESKLL